MCSKKGCSKNLAMSKDQEVIDEVKLWIPQKLFKVASKMREDLGISHS